MLQQAITAGGRDAILGEPSLRNVENQLCILACELSILGNFDAARQLVSIRNKFPPMFDQPGLDFLAWTWKLSGEWPDHEAEEHKTEAHFASLHEKSDFSNLDPALDPKHEYGEIAINTLLMVGKIFDSPSWTNYVSEPFVKALDAAVRLAEMESSKRITDPADLEVPGNGVGIVKYVIVKHWNTPAQVIQLAKAEKLWPYYRAGMFAKELNLDRAELERMGQWVVDHFRARLASGAAQSPLADLPLVDLLKRANTKTMESEDAVVEWREREIIDEEDTKRTDATLFHPATSDKEITALEARLKVKLPEDYKDFLRITNGFRTPEDGGIFNGIVMDAAIHSTDAVQWLDDDWVHWPMKLLDLPEGIMDFRPDGNGMNVRGERLAMFDKVIEIGVRDIDHLWLIPPEDVARARKAYWALYADANERQKKIVIRAIEAFAGSLEKWEALTWCCVKCSTGGAAELKTYASFRVYLEDITWRTNALR